MLATSTAEAVKKQLKTSPTSLTTSHKEEDPEKWVDRVADEVEEAQKELVS